MNRRLVIGISGASGVIYGIRILEFLRKFQEVETHLVITEMGKATIGMETDYSVADVESLADTRYGIRDLAAAIRDRGNDCCPLFGEVAVVNRKLRERQPVDTCRRRDVEATAPPAPAIPRNPSA